MLPGVPIFGLVTVNWLLLIKERQRVNFRSEPGGPNSIFLGKSGMGELQNTYYGTHIVLGAWRHSLNNHWSSQNCVRHIMFFIYIV